MGKTQKEEEHLRESDERYKIAVQGWHHIYEAALNDLKFTYDVDGGQWNEKVRNDRVASFRPVITVNKLLKFVRQLRGDMMLNRPRIKVIPVDNKADVKMAGLYNGIIRQIEYLNSANVAYDTAYMHLISSSIGFFRIVTKYADDNSFDQSIGIERIINPFAVHYDPAASDPVYADARYCFIEENMEKKAFIKKHPGADTEGFSGDNIGMQWSNWFSEDNIKVAEYFYKEPVKKKIVQLNTGDIVELSKDITIERLTSTGKVIVKDREVNSHKVMWCKRSGSEILEGPTLWPGKNIPIIPVLGDEIVVNGKKHYLSLIRGAKGPQEMYNYWAAAATESVASIPKSLFIVDHKQIKGFEKEWEDMSTSHRPYARFKSVAGVERPRREPQTSIPTAIISMMQSTSFDIEDHLGRYESSKGEASNERSRVAILARIAQSDKGTYNFTESLTRAIVYAGRQFIDLIPKIYDTNRALRIMGEEGKEEIVQVNIPIMDAQGNIGVGNDLSVGEFDLIATVGASYSSKRQEINDYMLQAMQYSQGLADIIAPLIFKFSDSPGAEEIYNEIKKEIDRREKTEMSAGKGAQNELPLRSPTRAADQSGLI